MEELEQAAINERRASDYLRAHDYMNVWGKSQAELDEMAINRAKAQVEYLKARNKLDDLIIKQTA